MCIRDRVSLLPYLGLALYPFEDKFRMSKIKLSGCIVILTVIQSALGIYATMCSQAVSYTHLLSKGQDRMYNSLCVV